MKIDIFSVEGAYSFRTSNDINLNWLHYHAVTNKGTIVVPSGSSFLDSESNGYASGIITTLRRPTWDAANAEFGQVVHFSQYDDIR